MKRDMTRMGKVLVGVVFHLSCGHKASKSSFRFSDRTKMRCVECAVPSKGGK